MHGPIDLTKTHVDENEVHDMLKVRAYSIVNNVPAPKMINNGSMANVEADQQTKFELMQCDEASMLRVSHLNEEMSDMKNNMIAYDKGLQKGIREIAKNCPKDGKERHL